MEIVEFKASEYLNSPGISKLRIDQGKGMFVFSIAAAKELGLTTNVFIRIGYSEGVGYLLRVTEEKKDSFRLSKSKAQFRFTCKQLALNIIEHHEQRHRPSIIMQIEKNALIDGSRTYHALKPMNIKK